MADERRSNRKPVSLNDRHYRLLQDLSAPPKPPPSSSEEVKPSKVKLEGRSRLCKAVGGGTGDSGDVDDIPQFSGIVDFDSSPEEANPVKVKIEGRRRLCKVSSRDNEKADTSTAVDKEPTFFDITDFDSPQLSKSAAGKYHDQGANEIRDILDDLTSRLDVMSIEKKRVPRNVNSVVDAVGMSSRDGDHKKIVGIAEYASAESTFSHDSDLSGSTSNINKEVGDNIDNAKESNSLLNEGKDLYRRIDEHFLSRKSSALHVQEEKESDLEGEFDPDDYVSEAQKMKKAEKKLNQKETKGVHESFGHVGQSFSHKVKDEDDDDDDCMILSEKKALNEKMGDNCPESSDFSSLIDVSDDYTNEVVSEDEGFLTLNGLGCTYQLPGSIAKILYPHQLEGLKWLWSLHCQGKGGILGDDMGLGKTMQICGYLAGLFHSRLIKRVLVVAPKTLLSHWIKELSVVGLSGKTREYFSTSIKTRQYELQYVLQDKGILLTTYDIVRNNSKSLRGDHYFFDEDSECRNTWDYMILDEGHLIKNPSTQRAKSLLEIPSAHRIIISGTPIQNNLKELWALFNFCCPDLLGDYKWFKEHIELPILHGNEKNAYDREKYIGSKVAKELRERIQPYFLRRLKTEVFKDDDDATNTKLSKKNEIIVWLKLTSCQRQLYEAFLQSELVLSAFDGSPLAALTILKKICDHPLLLTKRAAEDVLEGMETLLNPEDVGIAEKLAMHVADVAERTDFQEKHDYISCKISFILSLLDNLIPEGHNVLVFSQTRKMLNLIQESLLSNGYEFLRIDGTTKAIDRVKIVNEFQEGAGASIFLLTSQVGGLGLTLTKADRVIVADPAWNPSTDNQSVDRAYRIGQKKDVLVYRLMTCGTVEEKIYRKQIFKGGLFKTATEHKEQIRYFSQQDLRELFSLPKQGFDVSLTQQQLHEEHDSQHEMDKSLEAHIKFLESLGVAGVSHHSLLFSKTAPAQVVPQDEEEKRGKGITIVRHSSRCSSEDHVDGAMYAFKPKDVNLNMKSTSPESTGKLTESQIKERINRLSLILANKATVSKLPDGGAKLQKQISELNLELHQMRIEQRLEEDTSRRPDKEVIELDDLTGELQRVLNV
ncbi:hypothetical protein K2173_000913 [Erythroxylum novogranatense]|uniref:Protein CHROMATIN REMODELING 24 n=1 Tax=Erythroxylum novogranatense TaxID=1862640 RepID=A0AAV8TR18_9ROSI|nr:hypothetical protein K2173_000913 [Erythroxylum novogranatense]